jgi:hypothetical protein
VKQWCILPLRCHRGSDPLNSVLFFWLGVNVGSRAHYIGTGGGAHCPLIEGIAPDQDREVDLVPCGSSLLEINSNILPIDLHVSILNSKLKTKIRLNIHFLTD